VGLRPARFDELKEIRALSEKSSSGILTVVGIGLFILAVSVIGVAADFMFDLKLDMDGLLLISVCLLMALVSAAMLFFLARAQGWLGKGKPATPAAPVAGGTPAAAQK
jgi:hypothetical protein